MGGAVLFCAGFGGLVLTVPSDVVIQLSWVALLWCYFLRLTYWSSILLAERQITFIALFFGLFIALFLGQRIVAADS